MAGLASCAMRPVPAGVVLAGGERYGLASSTGISQGIPTASSVITSDAFSGGDLTNLEARNTDVAYGGSAKTWSANTTPSGVGIISGRMTRTSGTAQRRLGFDAGTGDVYIRCKVYESAGVFGAPIIQARRADVATASTDHYKIEVGTTGSVLLRKNVSGSNTTLYTHPAAATDGTEVGLFVKGSLVGLTVNGSTVFSTLDADVANSRTWVAIQVQTQTIDVDDLIVQAL